MAASVCLDADVWGNSQTTTKVGGRLFRGCKDHRVQKNLGINFMCKSSFVRLVLKALSSEDSVRLRTLGGKVYRYCAPGRVVYTLDISNRSSWQNVSIDYRIVQGSVSSTEDKNSRKARIKMQQIHYGNLVSDRSKLQPRPTIGF